jgi:HAD superfamily hydrolase (TIGR01509 family)
MGTIVSLLRWNGASIPPPTSPATVYYGRAAIRGWSVRPDERGGTVVDAVVFDLDGVLVDSEPVWEDVRRRYVADNGGHWKSDAQRRLMGMSTSEWAQYLSHELGVSRPPDQVARDVVAEMVERYQAQVPLIAGAESVVRQLAQLWPVGLASSSPPELIDAALRAAGLGDTFAVRLSTEQVERGTPAPDVYLAVAARLGVNASRCVAVEDSSNGIRSAAAAGMHVIAVPQDRYQLDQAARDLAALVVGHIAAVTPDAVRAAGSGPPVTAAR